MPSPEAQAYAFRLWSYKQGELVSLMVHLGNRLGLYRELAGAGRVTAAELAARLDLDPRWVLEWLRGQAAAELLLTDDGERFEMDEAGQAVLVDAETSLAYSAGAFGPPVDPVVVDAVAEAFRTGVGPSYDQRGSAAAHQTAAMSAPWARQALVPAILPALDGVIPKLRAGADVADVGCGAGVALAEMARAFPSSRFHGYDPSKHALDIARAEAERAGAENITLHESAAEDIDAVAAYDLVLAFDCLHDMTRPQEALGAIRRSLRDDGTLLVKEIRAHATFAANRANPMLAMLYGFSITGCLASATSAPGGAALGTVGLHRELLEGMTRDAGFSGFETHDFGDPANLYYEVRA